MALGGINAGWNEAVPSGTSQAGLGKDDIKSVKTSVRAGLDSEHIWSSTGGAGTGAHRKGSAMAFYGTQSAVSSSDTEGRLMLTSDTTRLYNVTSGVTSFIGGRFVAEWTASGLSVGGTATASKFTQIVKMEAGGFTMSSTGTTIILQNTYVYAIPMVCPVFTSSTSAGGVPMVSTHAISGTSQLIIYAVTPDGSGQTNVTTSGRTFGVNYMVVGHVAG